MNQVVGRRKTKIVCTMGPSTNTPDIMHRMIGSGMDVARLNFSHGDHDSHLDTIRELRRISRELGREVGILQDLSGPKIRLGVLPEPKRQLAPGARVRLVYGQEAEGDALPVNYPYITEDVNPGDRILLADGQVELLVTAKQGEVVHAEVVVGGVVSSHKGVNLPSSELRIPAFTEKDRKDLEFGLRSDVDMVAMSFVRRGKDLDPIREAVRGMERPPLLIAKIEKPQALEHLDEILRGVDGLMVARGDLGVEMPLEDVPIIQKRVIQEARRAGKVVITATQMLRSMITTPRPTRAEVTDVANAVLDGTDAVMLSDETAVGAYPVEAVEVLHKVCRVAEPQVDEKRFLREEPSELVPTTAAAISRAACWLAEDLRPCAIMAATASGSTARLISRYRPPFPVVGLTSHLRTCRQLCLSWGVMPALIPAYGDVDEMMIMAKEWARVNGVAKAGDRLILTAGFPLGVAGTTNLLKVIEMEEKDSCSG